MRVRQDWKWFGMEHWDVVPDMMTVAKGMTSTYLPMGAAVVKREIADAFASEEDLFSQALTFGGHPVSAAAALENIRIIERGRPGGAVGGDGGVPARRAHGAEGEARDSRPRGWDRAAARG